MEKEEIKKALKTIDSVLGQILKGIWEFLKIVVKIIYEILKIIYKIAQGAYKIADAHPKATFRIVGSLIFAYLLLFSESFRSVFIPVAGFAAVIVFLVWAWNSEKKKPPIPKRK